jgi:hypothetical protein
LFRQALGQSLCCEEIQLGIRLEETCLIYFVQPHFPHNNIFPTRVLKEKPAILEMLKSLRTKFLPSSNSTPSELDGSSTTPTLDHGITTAEKVTQLDSKAPTAAVDEAVDHAVDRARPNEAAQDGVTQAEAITLSWTKTSLGAAYVLYV